MEIKQLRYFVKVAELSSVGKASDFLNIAQPTLSRTIRALEIELKTNLFRETGAGFSAHPHADGDFSNMLAASFMRPIPPWTPLMKGNLSMRAKSSSV